MRAATLATSLLLAALLAGCGLIESTTIGEAERAVGAGGPLEAPPSVAVDGVAGEPFAWCWKTACVDGNPSGQAPPLGEGPWDIGLPLPLQEIQASVQGPRGSHEVPIVEGRLAKLPAGDWTTLTITVWFAEGGDAAYAWSVEP